MAILSTLLALSQPQGMWEAIIRAFESFTANYILAIILLTIIIRIIWAPMDLLNKRMSQKMTANQAKMQPELDKIKAKYGNNKQLLTQKQNEVYKKYNTNSFGSCAFMLVFMGLNLAIFLTLMTGLNNISNYKIYQNYENLKECYANCLNLTDEYLASNGQNHEIFEDYQNLKIEFKTEDGTKFVILSQNGEERFRTLYVEDFSSGTGEEVVSENERINELISKYITPEEDYILIPGGTDEEGNVVSNTVMLADAIQAISMPVVEVEYDRTQEKFLWIQNIWIADSPMQNSVFDYTSYAKKVGKNGVGENEEAIYKAFMTPLNESRGRVNGYFLLPILCIVITFLSMWLMNRKPKGAPPQAGGKVMKFVMPIIFGLFAMFYNAMFAIYMLASQVISTALMPLENLILKKWNDSTEKKKKEKTEVEYSRKF